jgi:hypothetical protein
VTKNVHPGQLMEVTISGEGQMPREAPGNAMGQPSEAAMGGAEPSDTTNKPGGGLGNPIDTPDPLTKYKWWILGILALLLAATAGLLLRKQSHFAPGVLPPPKDASPEDPQFSSATILTGQRVKHVAPAATHSNSLLNMIKEEFFSLERERVSGEISQAEYTEARLGLEAVLKRALRRP